METQVTFLSEDQEIQGDLCLPEGHECPFPAVLILHGYGAFRDAQGGFGELAALLAESGIASLRFDFRGCADSGSPGKIHPHDEWIEDVRSALSFLETLTCCRPGGQIDTGRLGLVGMSVGGGVTVQVTALDERVKCAVALCPVADGGWWLKHLWTKLHGEEGWLGFLDLIAEDRRARAATGNARIVPLEDVLVCTPQEQEAREVMFAQSPQLATHVYLSSADSLLQFQPRHLAHLIAPRPIRFIHSRTDAMVPIDHAHELFGRAGEVKDLQVIEDSPHNFWLGDARRRVQESAVEWFREHL